MCTWNKIFSPFIPATPSTPCHVPADHSFHLAALWGMCFFRTNANYFILSSNILMLRKKKVISKIYMQKMDVFPHN